MRIEIPIIGGAYTARSLNLNAQKCVNLYPVISDKGSKPAGLYGTPGLVEFCDPSDARVVRGAHAFGDYLYAVIGDTFYQINTSGTATSKGTVSTATGKVWMADNGTTGNQLMVLAGTSGYVYDQSADTFAIIADADFPSASSLTFQDGYGIITRSSTGQFWISDSYDFTSWDATYYATAEGNVDDVVCAFSDHRELWLFGTKSTEIWYNSGSGSPPFDRKIDEILERGISAAASIAAEDNTLFWLDDRKMVVKADGYRPAVISTREIDYQIAQYSDVSDAIGFTYSQEGQTFYVLTFPAGNATWVYDAATGEWHQRTSYPSPYNNRWRANCYAYFDGKHLVGDHSNGKIYELDLDTYADDGNIIKAIRTGAAVHEKRHLLFHNTLELEFEAGVGLVSGQGSDPTVMLRWSDDGGHTWSNEHWKAIGKIGEYSKRARWSKLGRSRDRIYEVSITDPVKRVLISANLNATKGMS